MYSTTSDLLIWERGLFGGKVLCADLLKEMTTPVQEGYGYGLEMRLEAGTTVVSHTGAIKGFNTQMAYIPEKKITVVALSNVNGPVEMGAQMVKVMLGEPVTLTSERREQAISISELVRFTGTYQIAPSFALTFTVNGDQLIAHATGQPEPPVFYEGVEGGHPRFFLKSGRRADLICT